MTKKDYQSVWSNQVVIIIWAVDDGRDYAQAYNDGSRRLEKQTGSSSWSWRRSITLDCQRLGLEKRTGSSTSTVRIDNGNQ